MKIIQIETDLCSEQLIKNGKTGNYRLIIAKTPVKAVVGNKTLTLGTDSGFILSGDSISVKSVGNNAAVQYDYLAFTMNAFELQYFNSLGIPLDMQFDIADDSVLRYAMRSIYVQNFRDEKKKQDFHEAALKMILLTLSEQLCGEITLPSSRIPHYRELYALRNSIYSDPVREWCVDDICAALDMSNTYFHRLYSEAFGVSCLQDVINSRLLLAEKLIVNTNKTISDIAEICGYENDSYFMRQFKKNRGFTPTEYRKKFSKMNFKV